MDYCLTNIRLVLHSWRISSLGLLLPAFFIFGRSTNAQTGPYFGFNASNTPQLLAPALLASPLDEYNGMFISNGEGFIYTTNSPSGGIITITRLQPDGSWSPPAVAEFSGSYSEYDPLISPDEKTIYFSSERPIPGTSKPGKTNIWAIPISNLDKAPSIIRLTDKGDYYSSLTKSGKIYFNTWSTGDIRTASPTDTGFIFDILPDHINKLSDVGDPYISPDEDYLIFRGYGGKNYGQGDLYITFRQVDQWSIPENLGQPINSSGHEMCPAVTKNGKMFIFASNRLIENYQIDPGDQIAPLLNKYRSSDNGNLNLYFMSTDFIETFRSKAQFK